MVKVSTPGIIFFTLALIFTFFVSRQLSTSSSNSNTPPTKIRANSIFTPTKSSQPTIIFFVMSFCPYGNQIETALMPVFDLLSSKINMTPHYIFEKITDLSKYCQNRLTKNNTCQQLVDRKYFQTVSDCEKSIADSNTNCLNEKNYIKASDGTLYGSMYGRQEANQDVREICAWTQAGENKKKWWKFVDKINKNCTAQNVDTCWEEQGKSVGLDTDKITECFNNDAFKLIESEINLSNKYSISISPTILINDSVYPPQNSYAQNSKGTIQVGDSTIYQIKYRTPNSIKLAICNSFTNPPKECFTNLDNTPDPNPSAIGCGI